MKKSVYEFSVKKNDGSTTTLEEYRGKVLLIVNTASRCGFTPQYEGLEALRKQYHERGFEVLAFPCNQFGDQEPGSDAEIATFCNLNYHTNFPLFAKIDVNGANAHPLYEFLKAQAPGILSSKAIKWNFTKFLVSRDGARIKRYAPQDAPASLAADVEKLLAE